MDRVRNGVLSIINRAMQCSFITGTGWAGVVIDYIGLDDTSHQCKVSRQQGWNKL